MSASSIIKRALADGVRIALSHVGTLKISGEPANVSRWADVVRSHKGEIVDALSLLEFARGVYFTHKDTCPICAASWAATATCSTHAELWQAYEVALVMVHGADKVLATDCQDVEPVARARYPSPTATKSEAPETSQAMSEPPAWTHTRDAYYSHIMECTECKPTGLCSEGQRLRGVFHSDFATSLQNSGA